MKLPKHINLTIEHNPHASHYLTAEEYLDEDLKDFASDIAPADRAAMIATGEIWEIQWYPDTPIGFYVVAAATLERALELANASG